MTLDEVKIKVNDCLEDACGLEESEYSGNDSLIDDLGVDSIDLVDFIYGIERAFGFSLKVGDLEKMAREATNGEFEIDGNLTEAGVETLRKLVPEIDAEKIKTDMPIFDLYKLYTPDTISAMVYRKLNV